MRRKRPTVAEQIRLGAYFFTTGAIDLAIAQFTAATKRAPRSATAWMNLGVAYLEKKDLARAEESLQRALGLRPDFAAAYYHLAQLCEERGENDIAKQYYQRAADLSPHTDLGRYALELATGWRPHIYIAGEDKRTRVD
jgi:tetratricopeptide (TPR) repeat protein